MTNGIIYRIYQHDRCYIGLTFRTARTRFQEHMSWSKYGKHNRSKCIDVLFNKNIYESIPKYEELHSIKFDEYNQEAINTMKDLEYKFIDEYKDNCVNTITLKPDPSSYFQKNKDKIRIKNKLNRFVCECGSNINFVSKSRHLNSLKHKNFVNQNK